MVCFEVYLVDMVILGEKFVIVDILFQMGLDSVCGCNGVMDFVIVYKWFNIVVLKGNKNVVQYCKEILGEMSLFEIVEVQCFVCEWLLMY